MTEFKKTLKQGTPGAAAYPVITPKATPAPMPAVIPQPPVSSGPISPVAPVYVQPRPPAMSAGPLTPDPRARALGAPHPEERAPTGGATPEAKGRQSVSPRPAGGSEPPPDS